MHCISPTLTYYIIFEKAWIQDANHFAFYVLLLKIKASILMLIKLALNLVDGHYCW